MVCVRVCTCSPPAAPPHAAAAAEAAALTAEARVKIKEMFEEAKAQGNQAYAAQRYEDALKHYHAAQQADQFNSTGMVRRGPPA